MAFKYRVKKRYLIPFILLSVLLVALLFSSSLLSAYASSFRLDNATKGADCILILSGNAETRPYKTAKLMQEGYAPLLYHTDQKRLNKAISALYPHPFERSQAVLASYNLSADIIPSTKGGATSTFDEAYDLAAFLKHHRMQHIILVTDAYHTSRAHYAFKKILDAQGFSQITIEMAAADNDDFCESNWWRSEKGISAYILEPIKYLFYILNTSNSTLVKQSA